MTRGAKCAAEDTEKALRIAVSGLFLAHPHTGTGRYAREVIQYLITRPDFAISVIVDGPEAHLHGLSLEHTSGMRGPAFVRAPMPPLRNGSYERKLLWEQVGVRLAARHVEASVLYSPHFSVPMWSSRPTVVSVHDLIPLTDPAYSGSVAAQMYFRLVSAAARRADAVITLSEFCKAEIERVLRIPGNRIHVVAPGADAAFNSAPDTVAADRARTRYDLPDRYLLYVGGADTRKNIGVLLRAMQSLGANPMVPALVVAAALPKPGRERLYPDWRSMAAGLRLGSRVRFIERIAEQDLAAVYREAYGFLFPSRAEGFGLDPLEAMACGTPVVCSSATSLPEAVGDAGLLVPPDDVDAWAEAIKRVCADDKLRLRCIEDGLDRAKQFRWDETGARVAEIIRMVA